MPVTDGTGSGRLGPGLVAAFEARSEKGSAFSVDTFNSSRMNKTALVEIALAYLITQGCCCGEVGKLIARRSRTAAR
ncbi:MAG TPA: hypothetical protein VI094_23380 [Propionibacteriaceae bacterium]